MEVTPLDEMTFEAALPLGEAWGYSDKEFGRLVDWTAGCGRLVHEDERAVGMALGFPWGQVGWIGDVLVLDAYRGGGLGQAVTEAAVQALQDHGCTTVKLYATPKAIPLYTRMGFQGEAEYVVARGSHKRGRDPAVVPLAGHLEAALALDAAVFPGDRRALIERQLADDPELAVAVLDDEGELVGYGTGRGAEDVSELGPIVVRRGEPRHAQAVVDALLTRVPEGEVEVTYPRRSWAAESSWSCRGFVTVDTPLEMRLGPPVDEVRGSMVAAGGQELG